MPGRTRLSHNIVSDGGFYGLSWGVYLRTSRFLDWDAVRFAIVNLHTGNKGIVLAVPPGGERQRFRPVLVASAKVLPQSENDLYFVPTEAVKLLP